MGRLRRPFLIVALILMVLVVLGEAGSLAVIAQPGFGIGYLALLDGLLLCSALLIGSALLVPERIQGRIQGIILLIVSIIVILLCIVEIFKALAALILMLALLLAPIFGTIAYFAKFSSFPRSEAKAALSLLTFLKLAFAVFLVLAHQRFLQNKSLVLVILTSLVMNLVVAFLHGLAPIVFVRILDAVAGIIVGIVALIWAIFYLIFAVVSIVKVIRVDRAA